MRLLADDLLSYAEAVALLAIHSAISLNDAVQVAVTGGRSKYEDHKRTTVDLEHICKRYGVPLKGVQHLRWLLSNKTEISYADRTFARSDEALDKAMKFHDWAYNNFKEVLREQER
jgi:hypothetical protein